MGRGRGRMGETPGGRGARLYEDAAGAGKGMRRASATLLRVLATVDARLDVSLSRAGSVVPIVVVDLEAVVRARVNAEVALPKNMKG